MRPRPPTTHVGQSSGGAGGGSGPGAQPGSSHEAAAVAQDGRLGRPQHGSSVKLDADWACEVDEGPWPFAHAAQLSSRSIICSQGTPPPSSEPAPSCDVAALVLVLAG